MQANHRVNILLVDDRLENLLALEAVLSDSNYNLVKARSGEEALKSLLRKDFAIILLDVQMPGMNGFETAALIRQREKSRNTPIIFITAIYQNESHVLKGYAVGAVDYILKPFDPEILKAKVKLFADQFQKTQAERERLSKQLETDHAFLETVIQQMPAGVILAQAPTGKLILSNHQVEEILKHSVRSSAGMETHYGWQGFHPGGRPYQPEEWPLARSLKTGEIVIGEEIGILRGDGTFGTIRMSSAPIRDRIGHIVAGVVTFNDISEHRRAEEALRQEDQLIGAAHDAIIIMNPDRTIRRWNAGATELFGWTEAEARGKVTHALLKTKFVTGQVNIHDIDETLYRENRWDGELTHTHRDGRQIIAESRQVLLRDGNGSPVGILAINRDITERKRIAEERAQLLARERAARSAAEAANRAKDEFLATLSHELRTPLTSILGWARMLSTGSLDKATTTRALDTIERNARTQAQIVEDLLDISRIISGKLHLSVGHVELAAVVKEAGNAVSLAAEAKGIYLRTVLDSKANLISGDADRLQQVVWNLLSNAIKFTGEGGSVEVRLQHHETHAEISVRDTGQGIRPDFLPHVFDRFSQADGTSTRTHGGLGLGLAVARHLVELHGGTIHAESPGENQGATFTVRLPLPSARAETDTGRQDSSPMTEFESKSDQQPPLQGVRVLVVDDEADTLEMLSAILVQSGADVTPAASAAAAIAVFTEQPPDVLIADIGMPVENGYDLIRKVRMLSTEQGGRVAAVALTAYARVEDRLRALSSGYQMHVPKPIEPSELVTIVASLLGRGSE